jgi:head-tail adaptor
MINGLREVITIQRNDPPTLTLTGVSRSSTTATATTTTAHGYSATDYVTIAGTSVAGYNGKVKIVAVPLPTTFTFTCNGSLATPATGGTVVYTSNAQGGQGQNFWRDVDSMAAELIPLGAMERLQMQAIQSDVNYRFRVRARADLDPTMRLLWTPHWPLGATQKTLVISGIIAADSRNVALFIEASEVMS